MLHPINPQTLHLIDEMDRKIGEFMQKRSEVVNRLVADVAEFKAGDRVLVYDGEVFVGEAIVVQPLFLKKNGVVAYRLQMVDGEVFTNMSFYLQIAQ